MNTPKHNQFSCLHLTQFMFSTLKKDTHKNGSISHYKMLSKFLALCFKIEQ